MKARIRLGEFYLAEDGGFTIARGAAPTYSSAEAEKLRDKLRKQGYAVEIEYDTSSIRKR